MLGQSEHEAGRDEIGGPALRDLIAASLLDTLPSDWAVLAFDRDARFVSVDGDALRRAGYADECIVGHVAHELLAGHDDAEELLAAYRAAMEGGRTHLRLDLEPRCWDVDVGPVHDPHGAVVGGLVVGRDVTSRRQARRLHDARARAAAIIATG